MTDRIPQPFPGKFCEVCGAPATRGVRDMKQTGDCEGWVTFEPDGPPHLYCELHDREPVTTYLEGDLVEDSEE